MLFFDMVKNLFRYFFIISLFFISFSFPQKSSQHSFIVNTDQGFIDYSNRIIVCRGTAEIEEKTPIDNSLKINLLQEQNRKSLEEVNNLKSKFDKHNMNMLSLRKPKLIENIINKGTKGVLNDFETLTTPVSSSQ